VKAEAYNKGYAGGQDRGYAKGCKEETDKATTRQRRRRYCNSLAELLQHLSLRRVVFLCVLATASSPELTL